MDVFNIILWIIFLVLCLYLWRENRQLKEKLKRLELENGWHKKVFADDKDTVSIQTLSEESSLAKKSTSKVSLEEEKENLKLEVCEKEVLERKRLEEKNRPVGRLEKKIEKPSLKDSVSLEEKRDGAKRLYQKNVFVGQPKVTSPVGIQNGFDMDKLSLDLNEFIKKSERVVPKIQERTSAKKNDYLKKISEEMAGAMTSQAIELTDYERNQEEHAIISYRELLAVKDQLSILDDEEESVDFMEELKKFRSHLE